MAKALYGYVKAAEELAGIPVQSVKITNAPTAAVTRGDTLTASVFPEDASDKTVTWESSNSSLLFFHDHGSFSIKHDGTVTVTAKAGGKSDSCSIKVQIPTVSDEEIWTVPNFDVPL